MAAPSYPGRLRPFISLVGMRQTPEVGHEGVGAVGRAETQEGRHPFVHQKRHHRAHEEPRRDRVEVRLPAKQGVRRPPADPEPVVEEVHAQHLDLLLRQVQPQPLGRLARGDDGRIARPGLVLLPPGLLGLPLVQLPRHPLHHLGAHVAADHAGRHVRGQFPHPHRFASFSVSEGHNASSLVSLITFGEYYNL